MSANFPDLPTTEINQAQGPSTQAVVGTAYSAVEYIEVIQRLPMGPQGPQGPTGPAGEEGAEWFFGFGPPTPAYPVDPDPNDMYIDSDTGDVWAWDEVSGSWVNTGSNLSGPTGPTGPQGQTGVTGPTGPTGMQGGGILVVGTIPTVGQPPPFIGTSGEGWVDAAGHLWGWIEDPNAPNGGYWHDYGPISGPTGPAGPGVVTFSAPINFATNPSNTLWATQTINHTLANGVPSVRILIDFDRSGTWPYSVDHTVGVSYPSNSQVVLTAEGSIVNHNGWGTVVLQ